MLAQLTRRVLGPALSAEEAEIFRRDGVLGPFTAFSPQEAREACRVITNQVLTTPTPHSGYHHCVRHLDSQTVYQLCASPEIVKRLTPLYGPDLLLWYSVLFDKPPARPGAQEIYPWHQDHYNWNLEPMLNASAWLALTPATVENGCVEVIPGSHRTAVPMKQDDDERYSPHAWGRASDPAFIDESKARPMVLQPGQFFLFNERTVHRSGPNLTNERRIGLSIRVTVPFVRTYTEWPSFLLSGKDRCGVNSLGAPPTGEPNIADWPNGLPRGRDFLFDSPPPGLGWHLPEANDSARWTWTGPGTSSWLSVRPGSSGKHMFRCHIRAAIAEDVLTGLEVWLDDTRLDLAWRTASPGVEVTAPVRATLLQENRPVRLTLRVPRTVRACDQNSTSTDARRLGLAIGRIGLVPANW